MQSNYSYLFLSICIASSSFSNKINAALPEKISNQDEYIFDSVLFRGQSIGQTNLLERLTKKQNILPGTYKVDVYVNNHFIQRMQLEFKDTKNNVQPCFLKDNLKLVGLNENYIQLASQLNTQQACFFIQDQVKDSRVDLNFSNLRLDLSIPQNELLNVPRGYVSPSEWNSGNSIGFVNYIANFYHNSFKSLDSHLHHESAYLSLNGGLNIGKLQYRQQSNWSYDESHGSNWKNIRSYFIYPLASISSQATFGQIYTTGQFFSGLSFNGLSLASDDRMLPESVRGYAPVVQGIAKTNAKVSILQNGNEIYQTTVAPGAFKISDLYPTNYNGDLTVLVKEADGSVSQFKVPFSAVPESLRAGSYRYNLNIGRTRDIGEDTYFSDITYQRGLNNIFTVNSGARIADGYQAFLFGSTYTTGFGAFGANITYSHADLINDYSTDGWLASMTYSKTFNPTNTNISIAGYRYSTEGYRDLGDVIGVRYSLKNGNTWKSSSYLQRSKVELTLNQNFNDYGILFISGSLQDYRDGRDRDVQTQIGYNKTFKNGISMNLSLMRKENVYYKVNNLSDSEDEFSNLYHDKKKDTTLSLSLNFPLDFKNKSRPQYLDLAYSHHSDSNDFYQTNLSGTLLKDHSINYSVGVSHNENIRATVWNTNVNKRFANLSAGLNTTYGEDFWQASANAQGALAIHSEGITLGPYLGETFALIEAKGAEGAKVYNGQGTKINRFGYALIPSLMAYRYNNIALDPQGIAENVEIESGEQQIAPYAGAAVKVKFKTRTGYPLLIQAKLNKDEYVPLGAEVIDDNGNVIGMVGQNGQMYVRTEKLQGQLKAKWGDLSSQQCSISYALGKEELIQPIIRFTKVCSLGVSK